MTSTARPNELLFAVSIAAAVAFCWINVRMASVGVNEDFRIFQESARAFLEDRAMYGLPDVLPNLNPPHVHLLLLPIGQLSRRAAFVWWMAGGVLCLLASLRLILRELTITLVPWTLWLTAVAVVSAAATTAVISTGQISWILMLPMTLAWRAARRGQWTRTGIVIGVLASAKLFLLVLIPYLLIARRWKAAVAAVLAGGACFAGGLLIFGVQNHLAWIRALRSVAWTFLPMNASVMGTLVRSLTLTPAVRDGAGHFAPLVMAPQLIQPLWWVSALSIGALTLAALRDRGRDGDRSAREVDRSFALVLVAALLISPLGWIYYLWFAVGPLVALAATWGGERDGRSRFLTIAAVALFWPIPLTMWLQPLGVLTVTIGSAYFWSMLALWAALLLDRRADAPARPVQ